MAMFTKSCPQSHERDKLRIISVVQGGMKNMVGPIGSQPQRLAFKDISMGQLRRGRRFLLGLLLVVVVTTAATVATTAATALGHSVGKVAILLDRNGMHRCLRWRNGRQALLHNTWALRRLARSSTNWRNGLIDCRRRCIGYNETTRISASKASL